MQTTEQTLPEPKEGLEVGGFGPAGDYVVVTVLGVAAGKVDLLLSGDKGIGMHICTPEEFKEALGRMTEMKVVKQP